ncbi:MAG: DinB family protein [Rhizobiaceae bacterium]
MKRHYMMMAAYNAWANARLFDAAAQLSSDEWERDTGVVFGSMMGTLNHLLVTDRIWLKRMSGTGDAPNSLNAIIHRDFAKLRAARINEDQRIIDWIAAFDDAGIRGRFSYLTVSDLRTVSQRLAPALAHLFNHQTHHRGQAHAILTILGKPSIVIDLIYFQRTPEGLPYA